MKKKSQAEQPYPNDGNSRPKPTVSIKVITFFIVIVSVMLFINIAEIIFFGRLKIFLGILICWLIYLIIRRRHNLGLNIIFIRYNSIAAFLGVLVLVSYVALFGFSSEFAGGYKLEKKYAGLKDFVSEELFPDELPEFVADYKADYESSIFEGMKYFKVHFRTTGNTAAEYKRIFSEKAIYTIPYSKFKDNRTEVEKFSPEVEIWSNNDKTLAIASDMSFWKDYSKDTTVYILYAVHKWHEPESDAVIINEKEGMVEFVQLR